MKWKRDKKGLVTQGIAQNGNLSYKDRGLIGHTGVDWTNGYGHPTTVDNTGYVYKVYKPQERKDNWTGIYQLVPHGHHFIEVCMGHFSAVWVDEGETVKEGQYVGAEGNFGTVFSGGLQITPEKQDNGDKRGSHVHESYRPVRRVSRTKRGEHYLRNSKGKTYRDADNKVYEIIYKDNGLNGCIDPTAFLHRSSFKEKVRAIGNAISQLGTLINRK